VIKSLITQRAPINEVKAQAVKTGMWTLAEDGLEKIIMGITSPEEILDVVFVEE
jgi:type II secretory ATPase GspE/PulE/Tfp pilus assembly ATPase PilB-like protein